MLIHIIKGRRYQSTSYYLNRYDTNRQRCMASLCYNEFKETGFHLVVHRIWSSGQLGAWPAVGFSYDGTSFLAHWGRDKLAAVFQTKFSKAFSWMKIYELLLRFDWNLFLRFELTVVQHWFIYWFGAEQATSLYLKQWWSSLLTDISVTRPQWVSACSWVIVYKTFILLYVLWSIAFFLLTLFYTNICRNILYDFIYSLYIFIILYNIG